MRAVWPVLLLQAVWLLVPRAVAAQGPFLGVGSVVRVYAPGVMPRMVQGRVESRSSDTITVRLRGGDSASLAVPVSALRRLWVQEGTRSRAGEGALLGALVGLGVGAAIGSAADAGCEWVCLGPLIGVVVGLPVGTAVGLVVGSHLEAPRWVSVRVRF